MYFFIYYPRSQKETSSEIEFVVPDNKSEWPECIYYKEFYDGDNKDHIKFYNYKKIYKIPKSDKIGNDPIKYHFEFEIGDDRYVISFKTEGNNFVYDVDLRVGKRIIPIRRKIDQNIIEYNDKIEDFIEALEENKESDKIDILYRDTIDLYSKKKGFGFLISIFLKLYKKKDLLSTVMKKFREMNVDSDDDDENMDRKLYLKNFSSKFEEISNKSEEIRNEFSYNVIEFYGIILCYLNYYDLKNFSILLDKLSSEYPDDTYEILLIYNRHFKNPINKNFDFFDKFIKHILDENSGFSAFKVGLRYIRDLENFLNVFVTNIDNICKKYIEPNKDDKNKEKYIIKLGKSLIFRKVEIKIDTKKYPIIISYIQTILNHCKDKNIFLIQLTSDFWNYILNYYKSAISDNIYICHKLREVFIQYRGLVNKLITNQKSKIYTDLKNYDEIDEFSYLLDQLIKGYINKNKELTEIDKLLLITKFNPYYDYNETKYSNKVDADIFDSFNLNKIDNIFIENYLEIKFELIFKENIHKYIEKIVSKIQKISDFENIIKLINFDLIDNKNIILDSLAKSYDNILGKAIEKFYGKKLEEAIKVVAHLVFINFIYKEEDNKFDFIRDKISELSEKIQPLIFIELLKLCLDDNNENNSNNNKLVRVEKNKIIEMKNFIFDIFSKKVTKYEDIQNIIKLIDCLQIKINKIENKGEETHKSENLKETEKIQKESEDNINEFLDKLMENNLFTKEEFFSDTNNFKIDLMYELYNKDIIKRNNENYYTKIEDLLKNIKKDLDGNIRKKKLEDFLKINESLLIKRLELIKILSPGFEYNPKLTIENLKKDYKNMSTNLENLQFIKENIIKYFNDKYKEIISDLIDNLKVKDKLNVNQYKRGGFGNLIKRCNQEQLPDLANKISKVKNFLLFKVIYEINPKKDDETDFKKALDKSDNIKKFLNENGNVNDLYKDNQIIVNRIRDILCNNEEDAENFIKDLKRIYNINNDTLIDELTILFNTKKYDLEINSIIFFFNNFPKDNDEDWNNKISKEYLNLLELTPQEIKNKLKELNDKGIYNYRGKNNNYTKLFKSLYKKQEAIDFIFEKINQNINIDYLEEKIQPTNRAIKIEDVIATEKCIFHMSKMKDQENNFKRLEYIKGLDPDDIAKFVKYSEIYKYIIELDRVDDSSDNIYDQIINIIKIDLTLKIDEDSEKFYYISQEKNEKVNIKLQDLIHLKNKIHIDIDKNDENKKKSIKSNFENNKIEYKTETMIFFTKLIIKLETINKYMRVLRMKGSTLPINIIIKVKMLDVKYFLEDKEMKFNDIQNFLLTIKNKHISQLNKVYKEEMNIRFLFGKQFRSFIKHLESNFLLDSFLRYILNNTNNNIKIKEGEKIRIKNAEDFITQYELYNKNSFESISMYIRSLFEKNNINGIKTIADHYKSMIITPKDRYRGIYIQKCDKNTMEKFIIDLFWDKLTQIPIAQNVLITNKSTSSEEIQSFLHRAILCNYNTLFVVEINDSFSEYQQSIMISYLDHLLSYRNEKYIEDKRQNIGKKATKEYLCPCIVFIYEETNKEIDTFLKEINKVDKQTFNNIIITQQTYSNKIIPKLGNINIITSEICGLGKSEKIKKLINSKHYFHFPLGGILTKEIIYSKLEKLLEKIKNYNYKDVAIHLDLTETKVISIMNEFFFSLLITKFYSNNENVLFIPKDILIYIEIPNSFEDYLSNFCVLNIFKKENITLNNLPDFNYSTGIISIFKRLLDNIDSNPKIKEFVKENIGITKYSFHQINIFIKLFTSQFINFNRKLTFTSTDKTTGKEEDVTNKRLEEFAKCTRYFTNGGFAELLTNPNNKNYLNMKTIDKLSKAYKDDLSQLVFDTPLIFLNSVELKFQKFYIPGKHSNNYRCTNDFLTRMKNILDIKNEVDTDVGELKSLKSILEEKDKNYVITIDNFRKMILLVYRIRANVPVIIMGDTGCGKTMLITKLNQLLNNGIQTVEIINIHPGINDEKLCEIMDKKDEIARKNKNKEIWLFFDEINTCLSLSLITEIFINRAYGGKKISDNIRLIGACNPYIKRKKNTEKCGLTLSDDNDNDLVYLVQPLPQSLLYYVFSFGSIDETDEKKYINSIIEKLFNEDEKDLHECTTETISACHKYLRDEFGDSVVSLREIVRFTKCVEFFKEYFTKKNKFLKRDNNEKNNKIRSIICSVYLCYYIRLIDDNKNYQRITFETKIRGSLLQLVNAREESTKLKDLNEILINEYREREDSIKSETSKLQIIKNILDTNLTEEEKKMTRLEKDLKENEKTTAQLIKLNNEEEKLVMNNLPKDNNLKQDELDKLKDERLRHLKEIKLKYKKYYENVVEKDVGLVNNFKNIEFKDEIESRCIKIKFFSDFLKIEQNFLIEQIELDNGIGKNTLLKENVFLLFISLLTNIPLIIIGKPGSGKSLSAQLMYKSMRGEYSQKEFFKLFPKIIQTYFQGSESTQPEDVESLFEKAGKKLDYYRKKKETEKDLQLPISMVLFDELGLAEKSDSNPLKVLHSKLDYAGKEDGISFVGISNYSLDAAKINRALVLSVPDLDKKKDEIYSTACCIVQSICPNLKNDKIFEILSNTYFDYKQLLQTIKELIVFKKYIKKYVPEKKNDNINKDNNINNVLDKKDLNENQSEIEKSVQSPSEDKFAGQSEINLQLTESELYEAKKREVWEEINNDNFSDIKNKDLYKYLIRKEKKIRIDFHGNRDFYNLIKGIAYKLGSSTESNDAEKVKIVVKYIERNFGGIDYEIDIDLNLKLLDIEEKVNTIQSILQNYRHYKENEITKLKSVYLFKAIYNLQFIEKGSNQKLKIDPNTINEYNLTSCINTNIADTNSRYLLLEIKQSLTTLIFQNIKLQNKIKEDIQLLDGSPFIDDNNNAYRFTKLNQIQEDASKDKLIVIENLNQIHPFLFDLYNRNFQIVNGKKFARITLDNFDEQLTEVDDGFRIIILMEKRFVNKCNLAFLNRMEKMILSFNELLTDNLKKISRKLILDLNIENSIKIYEKTNNYSLQDLIINCGNEEIQGLIYHYSIESNKDENESDNDDTPEQNINEEQIRNNVIDKIYKILPQDIIVTLDANNILRKRYINNKKINNFEGYMNEEYKAYKISIIYTFTNRVEGLISGKCFWISEIRSESGLKSLIEEIKNKYNNEDKKYICIHFEQSNSKHIKFISNFILKYFDNDDFNYLIMIHINRNFNKVNERIYSLPDINSKINQIFIDNLNSNNKFKLSDILSNNITKFFKDNKRDLKLDDEFNKALKSFLKGELNNDKIDFDKIEEYTNDIENYMNKKIEIKDKIMDKTYNMINNDNDNENYDLISRIFNEKIINNFTVDIISCLLEYIIEKIFNKKLKNIFKVLEDNNILTTLIDIKNSNLIDNKIVENIIDIYLEGLTFANIDKCNCKFLFNYNVPGFYNFYQNISNYINKKIMSNYSNNESDLRESENDPKFKTIFHNTEEKLLENVDKEMEINYKFECKIFDILKDDKNDLIFRDYITFFLQKNKNIGEIYKRDDIYHEIIILILQLRFNPENIIINSMNKRKILLIKIIWLESNVNFILNVLKIIDEAKKIFNNDILLFDKLKEQIFEDDKILINYITDEKRNPEITKEVNECYYILLAGICKCITSDEIKLIENIDINQKDNKEIVIEINYYYDKLKEINKIMQILSDDLSIFLNEMYIIDELIKVIEIFKKKMDIEKINKIKKELLENANIIQDNFNKDDKFKFSSELISNFKKIYELITKISEIYKSSKYYYDNIKYILMSEIKKISDTDYRSEILNKLLEQNEMIKKSNDILQLVLKPYLKKKDKFAKNQDKILKTNNDNIIKSIELKLDNKIILEETLLYLFEKNSLIYFSYIKKNEINFDAEPLEIFKKCNKYLNDYINKSDEFEKLNFNKETCKLFCLGYIKSYCFTFINTFRDNSPKISKAINIIDIINNGNIGKMIRLYIYKILYNKYTINFFFKEENINKYLLGKYNGFNEFIGNQDLNNIYKLEYIVKTLNNDFCEESCEILENYKNINFKDKINKVKYNIDKYGIDNFYISIYNPFISYLQIENVEINKNFYPNICVPLFDEKSIILKALGLFCEPNKFNEICKKYNINSFNIKPFIFGFRYILNELSDNKKDKDRIYYSLLDLKNLKNLNNKYYPGNDSKFNETYSSIIDHFQNKPKEGCFVCLCKKMYYHSVPSGLPGPLELKLSCPYCSLNIGAYCEDKNIKIVKRDNYYRIFKDEDEKKEFRNNPKCREINYMTLSQFKEKYINPYFENERGILKTTKNNFRNINKIIRNLSQISYRLLNYILYIHLFFAKVMNDNNENYDYYLPDNMSWDETIFECWNFLKIELLELNIDFIEEFMYYIFPELFPILNDQKNINKYNDLVNIEKNLDDTIRNLIKKYNDNRPVFISKNKNNKDEGNTFTINLLTEKISHEHFNNKSDYPYYKYFYYTDYLNEKYIKDNMKDESQYPTLKIYLDSRNISKGDEKEIPLDKLYLFNNTLKLISQKYFNNISRDKKIILKDDEIYKKNKEKFNDFIEFYNKLNIKEIKNKPKLSNNNLINDFFVDSNNKYGKTYIEIYKIFIKQQNNKLENLLDIKYKKGIFDINCKNRKNIQQINENEIFTLKLPPKVTFIDIMFNSCYRKILDNLPLRYSAYKDYKIDYNLMEEIMTELLLKNKKLLNENITEFIYNNEVFSNQVTDIITTFKTNYTCVDLVIDDKLPIYLFYKENSDNSDLYVKIINDFIELIKYLNNCKKENILIKEDAKLYEIFHKLPDLKSGNFIDIFMNYNNLTINKTVDIFEYFLKIIFSNVCSTLNNYQEELNENSKETINNYFNETHIINRKDIAYATRIFITLVLFQEEKKKDKIMNNHNNIINYLKSVDLWKSDINNDKFNIELNKLQSLNVQIRQIISFYEIVGNDFDDNFLDDVKLRDNNDVKKGIDSDNDIDEYKQRNIDDDDDDDDDDGDRKKKKKKRKKNDDDDDDAF